MSVSIIVRAEAVPEELPSTERIAHRFRTGDCSTPAYTATETQTYRIDDDYHVTW